MCSMLLTVVVIARSEMVTIRPSTSFGERPVNCQITEITGMLISGKMSVGIRAIEIGPPIAISSAITMKVYGRRRARRTIHMRLRQRNSRAHSGGGGGGAALRDQRQPSGIALPRKSPCPHLGRARRDLGRAARVEFSACRSRPAYELRRRAKVW